MEKLNNEEQKYKDIKKNKYQAGRKQANSVGYNPVNFTYENSVKGKETQDRDEMHKMRQIARA